MQIMRELDIVPFSAFMSTDHFNGPRRTFQLQFLCFISKTITQCKCICSAKQMAIE